MEDDELEFIPPSELVDWDLDSSNEYDEEDFE
jgi:hypothetical protein